MQSTRRAQVAKAIAEASNVFNMSLTSGVGLSLRRIRIEKASKLLRQVEFQCNLEELVQVKRQLLIIQVRCQLIHRRGTLRTFPLQCEAVNLFQKTDMNQQDLNDFLSHFDEALDIWAWRCVHPNSGFLHADAIFRKTLSSLPDVVRQCSHPEDTFRHLQSLLAKSKVSSDPLLMPLRMVVSHFFLEKALHEAVRHFEAGRWAPAMSLLKSQDAAVSVLMELEDAYERAAAKDNSSSLLRGYELGTARLTRTDFDLQLAICQGSQLVHTGDWHFREAEVGMAEDMMGRAQLAQDDYRQVAWIPSLVLPFKIRHSRAALLCVTGQDVELEGIALARLARFYAKVVKLPVP
jgi:hypothetical protein